VPTPLRFGLLGCADIAWRRSLPALAGEPSARLVAVAGRDRAKAARFAERFGAEDAGGYRELLKRDDIDAVYLPLPTGLHAEWIAEVLESGRHVLVEKPMTMCRVDTERLLRLAEERGLVLRENFTFPFHGQHRAVRELLVDGTIGELRGIVAAFGIPPLPATDIRYQRALGGGALLDVGVYPVGAAALYLGDDLAVVGATGTTDPAHGVDVAGAALLRTSDGVTAQLSYGFTHGYRAAYELWGSRGRIVLERAFTPPDTLAPVVRVERQNRVEELTLPADSQFGNAVRAFVGAVADRTTEPGAAAGSLQRAALLDAVRNFPR
jgi:NDP-hexose-3-ketoreductase